MTENRYSNVDQVLAENVRVVKMESGKYGWDFVGHLTNPAEEKTKPFYPQGQHENYADALNAGIGYIRATNKKLVDAATKVAIEGEKYRKATAN